MVNAPCVSELGQYLRQRQDFSSGEQVDTTILNRTESLTIIQ